MKEIFSKFTTIKKYSCLIMTPFLCPSQGPHSLKENQRPTMPHSSHGLTKKQAVSIPQSTLSKAKLHRNQLRNSRQLHY